jgi:hypothetical protein
VAPPAEYVSSAQVAHAVLATAPAKVPAVQLVQLVAAGALV